MISSNQVFVRFVPVADDLSMTAPAIHKVKTSKFSPAESEKIFVNPLPVKLWTCEKLSFGKTELTVSKDAKAGSTSIEICPSQSPIEEGSEADATGSAYISIAPDTYLLIDESRNSVEMCLSHPYANMPLLNYLSHSPVGKRVYLWFNEPNGNTQKGVCKVVSVLEFGEHKIVALDGTLV